MHVGFWYEIVPLDRMERRFSVPTNERENRYILTIIDLFTKSCVVLSKLGRFLLKSKISNSPIVAMNGSNSNCCLIRRCLCGKESRKRLALTIGRDEEQAGKRVNKWDSVFPPYSPRIYSESQYLITEIASAPLAHAYINTPRVVTLSGPNVRLIFNCDYVYNVVGFWNMNILQMPGYLHILEGIVMAIAQMWGRVVRQ